AGIDVLQVGEKIDAVIFAQRLVAAAYAFGEFGDRAFCGIDEADGAAGARQPGDRILEKTELRQASRFVIDERKTGADRLRIEIDRAFTVAACAGKLVTRHQSLDVAGGALRRLRERAPAEGEQENKQESSRPHA